MHYARTYYCRYLGQCADRLRNNFLQLFVKRFQMFNNCNYSILIIIIIKGGILSGTLQEVRISIFDAKKCHNSYSNLKDFRSTFPSGMNAGNVICAGDRKGGKDACQVLFLFVSDLSNFA